MKINQLGLGLAGALFFGISAQAAESVTFGTNWVAQAEHGGFYQAVADGTYAECGLDVTIVRADPTSTIAPCCWQAKSIS